MTNEANPKLEQPTAGSAEHFKVQDLQANVARVADRFRALADRVERIGEDVTRVGAPGRLTYGGVVAEIHREMYATLANVPLTQLIDDAAEADRYRAQGQ